MVHHALLNVIEPVFERTFSPDSHSCRKGKGTHMALDRFTGHARRHPWVLKTDIAKYFPSIDHRILAGLLARRALCERISRAYKTPRDRRRDLIATLSAAVTVATG